MGSLQERTNLNAEEKVEIAHKVVDLDEVKKKLAAESREVEIAQVGV